MRRVVRFIVIAVLVVVFPWFGSVDGEMDVGVTEGGVQFPAYAPLFAIGHRNISKKQFLVSERYIRLHGADHSSDFGLMSVRYGWTDRVTSFCSLPVFYNNTAGDKSDSGIGNFLINTEYIFFEKQVGAHRSEATVLGEIGFPTSTHVTTNFPQLGTQSYRFLLGTTGEYGTMYSYFYYSLGAQFYTTHEGLHPGTEFLYEWGISPIFYHKKDHDVIFFVEWNGRYAGATKRDEVEVPHTGGNILYMGPAVEYRYKNLITFIAFQAPVSQSFALKENYRLSLYVGAVF